MSPADWLDVALQKVVVDTGQLGPETRRLLDREARGGRLRKWRGHWAPVAGADWGLGPLKTCYGPA